MDRGERVGLIERSALVKCQADDERRWQVTISWPDYLWLLDQARPTGCRHEYIVMTDGSGSRCRRCGKAPDYAPAVKSPMTPTLGSTD